MKAILINSTAETIQEKEITSWRDIAPAISASLFTCVDLGGGETLYIDDEGLLTLTSESKFIFFEGANQPFAGNGLILGTDEEGESIDTALTVEKLKEKISFGGIEEARNF